MQAVAAAAVVGSSFVGSRELVAAAASARFFLRSAACLYIALLEMVAVSDDKNLVTNEGGEDEVEDEEAESLVESAELPTRSVLVVVATLVVAVRCSFPTCKSKAFSAQ